MKHLRLLTYLLLLFLWPMFLAACREELATSPSDQPTLSVDTLHMGLLLTDNSSPTYQVKLFNRCGAELRLTSIALRNAAVSGFRMNVDGMNGTEFTNSDLLRIASGDSMFIFVEATFAGRGTLATTQHNDYIDVTCNGRTQTIVLDAESKDVIKLRGMVLANDATWARGTEVQIYDSLVIPRGVTLTLADSTTFYLHDKAEILVRGTLRCEGTLANPVTLRGDRTDWMFDNLPYDNLPSQWGALRIDTSANATFLHTDIHGLADGIVIDSMANVTFDACRLKNSDGNLVTSRMARLTLRNCEMSNAAGALLDIYGGWNEVTHCTLANYNFAAVVTRRALCLNSWNENGEQAMPLHECVIRNTLIHGRWNNPDISYPSEVGVANGTVSNFLFDHCLLLANGEDDPNFLNNIWGEDPLFSLIDVENYTFDFHVKEGSPAIGAGSADGAAICPTDLDGKTRAADAPTIGCYEDPIP